MCPLRAERHLLACSYPAVPLGWDFVEEPVLSHSGGLGVFVEDPSTVYGKVQFWAFHSVPFVFIAAPRCLDSCSSVMYLQGVQDVRLLVFLAAIFMAVQSSLRVCIHFRDSFESAYLSHWGARTF